LDKENKPEVRGAADDTSGSDTWNSTWTTAASALDSKANTSADADLTRKSFQQEFASLIKSSKLESTSAAGDIGSIDDTLLISPLSLNTSAFSKQDLIEQVKIFNKYNESAFTALSYKTEEVCYLSFFKH
jgi:hypothetical protein